MQVTSKLPNVGTTIFTVMSALAQKHQAINLSQGFPDFDGPVELLAAVEKHMRTGNNQYPPMAGAMPLREAIAAKVDDLYGLNVDPESQVTVTAGATEALFCAIASIVCPGDEVILFDPAYDSYDPVVRLMGGTPIHLAMSGPDYRPDWHAVSDAISPRTRMIIINTPHNPTGAVWLPADIEALRTLVVGTNIVIVADEVYEHIIFDDVQHQSMCRYPDLLERSFVISSFGKTYHVTGWKVGYCVSSAELMKEFRRIHQFVTFTVNTPMQLGLADFLSQHPEHHHDLPRFYQKKRDHFASLLSGSRFELRPSGGTYFQLLNYSNISDEDDADLAVRWTEEIKVASIPVSPFYAEPEVSKDKVLRFCFAKDDATLEQAAEILCSL